MIFIGDIALPPNVTPRISDDAVKILSRATVANLEGLIVEKGDGPLSELKLFNHESVIDFLRLLNVKVVTLANNHIMDLGSSPSSTISTLKEHGILSCGAGDSIEEASRPAIMEMMGRKFVFLAFGWEVIKCRSAGGSKPGVNPLRPRHVLDSVVRWKRVYPSALLILLMHWNYELELYPQPMDRELAFAAIDAGANAVIGCHSHCVQGVEVYQNAPVVYGLGNWFLPHGFFFNKKLAFPSFANRQLAFEWDPSDGKMICHWFEYLPTQHQLTYICSEPLQGSKFIGKLTPFGGMDHISYISWFKHNRRKRQYLPIYTDYRRMRINMIKDRWVQFRQFLITAALRLGIKGGPK
jgi:poly-gamma-glutamate synthesis protein (capsule biosynthesis protein)